nr:hypothetical protein Iba_chr06fCG8650 [Ipomoea batatas]
MWFARNLAVGCFLFCSRGRTAVSFQFGGHSRIHTRSRIRIRSVAETGAVLATARFAQSKYSNLRDLRARLGSKSGWWVWLGQISWDVSFGHLIIKSGSLVVYQGGRVGRIPGGHDSSGVVRIDLAFANSARRNRIPRFCSILLSCQFFIIWSCCQGDRCKSDNKGMHGTPHEGSVALVHLPCYRALGLYYPDRVFSAEDRGDQPRKPFGLSALLSSGLRIERGRGALANSGGYTSNIGALFLSMFVKSLFLMIPGLLWMYSVISVQRIARVWVQKGLKWWGGRDIGEEDWNFAGWAWRGKYDHTNCSSPRSGGVRDRRRALEHLGESGGGPGTLSFAALGSRTWGELFQCEILKGAGGGHNDELSAAEGQVSEFISEEKEEKVPGRGRCGRTLVGCKHRQSGGGVGENGWVRGLK